MKPKQSSHKPSGRSSALVLVLAGSAVKVIYAVRVLLREAAGVSADSLLKPLVFDCSPDTPPELLAGLGLNGDMVISPDSFVRARTPTDTESLERAERCGLLRYVDENWYRKPGASLDNAGASGQPRVGITLAYLASQALGTELHKRLQGAIDYGRSERLILEGRSDATTQGRLRVEVVFSTTGATGCGAMNWFIRDGGIGRCAAEDGIPVKIVPRIISRGNLKTHNTTAADLNELTTLKGLRANATGMHVNPSTGDVDPVAFDHIYISSNINGNGNMTSLACLLSHEAHVEYFYCDSPAGRGLAERAVDIENWGFDSYGDPQPVFTMAIAILGRDSERVISYCTMKVSGALAQSLLVPGDDDKVISAIVRLADEIQLIESDQKNQITRRIMQPDELCGENVCQRAQAGLSDRASGCKGFRKASALSDAIVQIVNNEIPSVLEPPMRKQAQAGFEAAKVTVTEYLNRIMRTPQGLWEALQSLQYLKQLAEASSRAVTEKAGEIQEMIGPHEETLAEACEQLQSFEQTGRLARHINFPLVRRLISVLEDSGKALITCSLELLTCQIAEHDFIAPLSDWLDHKLAWLQSTQQRLMQASQYCLNKAAAVAAAPTILNVPVGLELATPEYLEDYFGRLVEDHDGESGLTGQLCTLFLARHGSFASITETPMNQTVDLFAELAGEAFEPIVQANDVIDEFTRLYPDQRTQKEMIAQLVRESEGRLQTVEEVNKSVTWLKAVNVPSDRHFQWVCQLLEGVDRKPGKWEAAVHGNPDQLSIAQMRGGISLTTSINRRDLPDDAEHWMQLIDKAVDPVAAIMAGPNPSVQQIKRLCVKAIACGLIKVGPDGAYVLHMRDSDDVALGLDVESVRASLGQDFRHIVFIESMFAHHLAVDESGILLLLDAMDSNSGAGEAHSQDLLKLLDTTAVKEVRVQVELLLPRLRRLSKPCVSEPRK